MKFCFSIIMFFNLEDSMKRFLLYFTRCFLIIAVFAFLSCDVIEDGEAILTIQNNSEVLLKKISYRSINFGDISAGTEITKNVVGSNSDKYDISFWCKPYGESKEYNCYTESFDVPIGETTIFEFRNDTEFTYFK